MKLIKLSIAALCLAGAAGCSTPDVAASAAAAPTPAPAPAAAPRGETLVATVEVTAIVTAIDQKTRAVTLKKEDGTEVTFVASEDVKNLAQVKVGDTLHVVYAEALAYEVRKGGTTVAPATAIAGGAAELGQRPAGALARQTTATVAITAIDPKVPSVTFQGPAGNTRTIKVLHPEKLEGVSVGDTVELTFTEALAIKVVETAAK
jgi:ribosomal 50S subunit-recycling heat shock protein